MEEKPPEIKEEMDSCAVCNPKKVGEGMNAYIIYTLVTKRRDGSKFETYRRFNDFAWLKDYLSQNFVGVIVPPMPEKAYLNRFTPEFIEYRRKELQKFINKLMQHPILGLSPALAMFLEDSQEILEAAKEKANIKNYNSYETKEDKKPPSKSFFSSLQAGLTSVAQVVTTPSVEEVDPWFTTQKEYLSTLEHNIENLQTKLNLASKKEEELSFLLQDVSKSIYQTKHAETDEVSSGCWETLSFTLEQACLLIDEQKTDSNESYLVSLKDNLRLVQIAKGILNDRWNGLVRHQTSVAELKVKEDKLKKGQNSQKVGLYNEEFMKAQDQEAQAEHDFQELSKTVKSELERFKVESSENLKELLKEVIRVNINYELSVSHLWKELAKQMEDLKETPDESPNNTSPIL